MIAHLFEKPAVHQSLCGGHSVKPGCWQRARLPESEASHTTVNIVHFSQNVSQSVGVSAKKRCSAPQRTIPDRLNPRPLSDLLQTAKVLLNHARSDFTNTADVVGLYSSNAAIGSATIFQEHGPETNTGSGTYVVILCI